MLISQLIVATKARLTASTEKRKHLDRDCVCTAAQYLLPTVFRHLVRQPCVDIDSRSTPYKLVRFTGILAFLCFGNFLSFFFLQFQYQ